MSQGHKENPGSEELARSYPISVGVSTKGWNITNRLLAIFESHLMLTGYGDYDKYYTVRHVTCTLGVQMETMYRWTILSSLWSLV